MAGRPTLALGSIDLHSRCSRRLASLFEPEPSTARSGDAAFRLINETTLMLRSTHTVADERGVRLSTVVDDEPDRLRPPITVSTEEQVVFSALVEHYVEAFGDADLTLDLAHSGATQRRDSASGLFTLVGRTDLVLVGQCVEGRAIPVVRRIHVRRPRTTATDAGLAVLLKLALPPAANDAVLVVQRLWFAPVPGVSEHVVRVADVAAFRTRVLAAITEARADPGRATPGWWCSSCPVLPGCPAIAQESFERLIARSQGDPA